MPDTNSKTLRASQGFSLIELLLVLTITSILTALALPAMVAQRRLLRSTAVNREITTQLRYARQLALSTRQSVTFQYDDAITKKQITIFNHNNNRPVNATFPVSCVKSRTEILGVSGFPNTACSRIVATIPLTQGGLTASEITYGVPSGVPATKLDDNIVMTALVSGKLNITFQADGSVVDAAGIPVDRAMYFFNNKAGKDTASAISVMGASGRAKVWRYTPIGNHFIE